MGEKFKELITIELQPNGKPLPMENGSSRTTSNYMEALQRQTNTKTIIGVAPFKRNYSYYIFDDIKPKDKLSARFALDLRFENSPSSNFLQDLPLNKDL